MASISDVAKVAGVSSATVSRVLNSPEKTPHKTREKVQSAIAQLNYRPNPSAQNIRRSQSGLIGVVMPGITPSFGRILSGAINHAAINNQTILISPGYFNKADEEAAIENLLKKPLDAIIYLPLHVGVPLRQLDYFQGIPIVGVGRRILAFDAPCVYTDNEKSGYIATEYLLSLGRKRLAFSAGVLGEKHNMSREDFFELAQSPEAGAYIACDRYWGYRRALEKAGVQFDPDLVFISDFGYESGQEFAQKIIVAGGVDGVVGCNDAFAIGLAHTLHSQGYTVPDEISVIGYDDIRLAAFVTPSLTSVHQYFEEIGAAAVQLVNRMLAGEDRPKDVVLEPSLVLRHTTVRHSVTE